MIIRYSNFSSIKYKLGFVIGVSTFLISSILIAYTTKSARDQAVKAAQENAMSTAKDYAGQIKAEIEEGLFASKTLAQSFAATKAPENPISLDRGGAQGMLKEVLMQNESFYGTFTSWESNAFDGQDDAFRNFDAAHDSSGRFIPYIFKENGQALIETTQGYDKDVYYTLPKKTKAEVIMDPVSYTVNGGSIQLISIVSPVINNNQFYGLTGVDIALDWMQSMVKNAILYQGKAQISIISHNGTIAASTISDTLIGQNLKAIFPDNQALAEDLKIGREGIDLTNDALHVHAPIYIGNTNTPWQISIIIPADYILAQANVQMWRMILIGLALLGLSLIIILIVAQRLIKPLGTMVRVAEHVSEGDLTYEKIEARKDEIGQLSRAMNNLVDGLRKTTDFANQIGKGNLEAEYEALSEKDMLGNALISMRNSLKVIAEEDAKRKWVTEGLAKFGDLLRTNNDNLKTLSETVIVSLVKYLGANQGSMFLIIEEEEESYLQLEAAYAWDRRRLMDLKIGVHEGLVGQAVLEKDYFYITDVPQDYVNISSGLGHANPTIVLIMPLMANEEVVGVLELASFKELEQYQIDFVKKIGETIASTLSTVRINETTRRLLNEARQITEEKRAAEEELLQNQEELQATQEEMHRTLQELKEENNRLQLALNAPLKEN